MAKVPPGVQPNFTHATKPKPQVGKELQIPGPRECYHEIQAHVGRSSFPFGQETRHVPSLSARVTLPISPGASIDQIA